MLIFVHFGRGPDGGIGPDGATHDIDITSRACASRRRGAPYDTPETAIDLTESPDHD